MKMTLLLALVSFAYPVIAAPVDVYFGTGGKPAEGIYRGKFDVESGKLSQVQLAAELNRPGFLARHPQIEMLYAIGHDDAKQAVVAAYQIDAAGALHHVHSEELPAGGAAHIAVHPRGKFLLTAHYGSGAVGVFGLNEDGTLRPDAKTIRHSGGSQVVPKRQEKPHPHWVGFSPDSRFAFVPDLGLDQIVIYAVDANERNLTRLAAADCVPGGGPRHMRFSVNGETIFLLNELALSVTAFAYDAESGKTERGATVPTLTAETKAKESFNSASEIVVHPSGKFLYTGNRGHDSVTAFSVDEATGELSVIEVEPIRGSWPRNINLDPSGNWLLAAGAKSNTVAVFRIDQQSGELQFPRDGVFSVPNVICILFR